MELGKLVRFFAALSRQPFPYIPEPATTLQAKETDMARSLFSSTAAPCLKCHATGDAAHDKNATAPNFLLARERLNEPGTNACFTLLHIQAHAIILNSKPQFSTLNG